MSNKKPFNSSITRVRPVFQQLIHKNDTVWIKNIIKLFKNDYADELLKNTGSIIPCSIAMRKFSDSTLKDYGVKTIELESCFEKSMEPAENFLRWLIENPLKMKWPSNAKYSKVTEEKRRALFTNDSKVQKEALELLKANGVKKSFKKWWSFEGFTEVDCLIETDTMILAIEGKRTEDGPSESIIWYKNRNQIIRNLETIQRYANGKLFAVILIDDKGDFNLTKDIIDNGLPHLTPQERKELIEHYLGSTTWKEICEATGIDYNSLPDTVEEAIKFIKV